MSDESRYGQPNDYQNQAPWPSQPSDGKQPPPGPRGPPRLQMTADELRVLRECRTESFWYRCVPLGVLFIGSTQMLVNRGILKSHPRFGALIKNMVAGFAAYVVGRMSYQGACIEKLLKLENSPIADRLRKGMRNSNIMTDMPVSTVGSSGAGQEAAQYSPGKLADDYQAGMHYDAGSNIHVRGMDDNNRPTLDRSTGQQSGLENEPSYTNYDDLRRQNRDDFEQRRSQPMGPPPRRDMSPPPTRDDSFGRAPPPPSSDMYSESSGSTDWGK